MNIKEAKQQIANSITAYFSRDVHGEYVIPIEKQRPIFLLGAPGIGKTAIVEQIAQELGVNLVSYSMTHHTRQSALGLPFIETKMYDGKEFSVSEYTMSEIIASVYDAMEMTKKKEGILFLDEINCVSETLAPAMLQFLQYKVFGRHHVPEGWIVVTAGNPPEYNNSVREFDIVTWDRIKRVDVEPDFDTWKEYAYKKGVHASVLTYLEIKKSDFYNVESTVNGKTFVTARGWDDLSQMIILYEQNEIEVNRKLICQYLQDERIARNFSIYYDLFNKYKSDYQIDNILSGLYDSEIVNRASSAEFDERLSLLGLLLDAVTASVKDTVQYENMLTVLAKLLRAIKKDIFKEGKAPKSVIDEKITGIQSELEMGTGNRLLSSEDKSLLYQLIEFLYVQIAAIDGKIPDGAFDILKSNFKENTAIFNKKISQTRMKLENLFLFCEKAFGDGQELLILVTELTASYYAAKFIGAYGCEKYFEHGKELQFYERQKEIVLQIEELDIEL